MLYFQIFCRDSGSLCFWSSFFDSGSVCRMHNASFFFLSLDGGVLLFSWWLDKYCICCIIWFALFHNAWFRLLFVSRTCVGNISQHFAFKFLANALRPTLLRPSEPNDLLTSLFGLYEEMILWNFEAIWPLCFRAMARPRIFSLYGIAASVWNKNQILTYPMIFKDISYQTIVLFFHCDLLPIFWPQWLQ